MQSTPVSDPGEEKRNSALENNPIKKIEDVSGGATEMTRHRKVFSADHDDLGRFSQDTHRRDFFAARIDLIHDNNARFSRDPFSIHSIIYFANVKYTAIVI